jgi:drug/metabolite transporter (DMT)-like permease
MALSRSLKAHALLVGMAFVWGSTFVLVKDALLDCTPQLFNAIRFSVSAVLLALLYRRHLTNVSRRTVAAGILVGVFLSAGYMFQNAGLRLTTPSKSAFLTGVSVVLVPVFLAVGWRKKVNGWTLLGVAAAFLGLYLLTVPANVPAVATMASAGAGGSGWLAGMNPGDLLTLGCAAAFALQIIVLGRVIQEHAFRQIVVLEIGTCAVLMAFLALWEQPRIVASSTVLWALGITVFFSTVAGFAAQGWAQQFTPPSHTALIFSTEPVFAWITSYLLTGERLGIRGTAGASLILAGVIVSELRGRESGMRG